MSVFNRSGNAGIPQPKPGTPPTIGRRAPTYSGTVVVCGPAESTAPFADAFQRQGWSARTVPTDYRAPMVPYRKVLSEAYGCLFLLEGFPEREIDLLQEARNNSGLKLGFVCQYTMDNLRHIFDCYTDPLPFLVRPRSGAMPKNARPATHTLLLPRTHDEIVDKFVGLHR